MMGKEDSGKIRSNHYILLAVVIIVICAILALSFIILNPKPPPVVSNPTTQNQSSQCFEIPTSPSKIQVLSFINLTKNGSECALAALREYQSANILTSYNISINLTSLAKNITTSSVNQNYTNNSVASSSCIMIPSNPTKAQVLSFINLTKNGSECALAALRGYQSANILADYNIRVNLTALANNLTVNGKNNNTGRYNCPFIPANPSKSSILSYINTSYQGGVYGNCALAALNTYNKSGILVKYNIHLNFTSTKTFNINSNPVYVIKPISQSITYNITVNTITELLQSSQNKNPNLTQSPLNGSVYSSTSSYNWAGYVVPSSLATTEEVTGSWIVQTAGPSTQTTYSSQWIGIGGSSDSTLIQTGTESDYINGQAVYQPWYELLPASETPISATVNPGDHVWAEIYLVSSNEWNITIVDVSQNWEYTGLFSYNSSQKSAEWIDERPLVGGTFSNLSYFGTSNYGQDYTGTSNTNYEYDSVSGFKTMGGFSPTAITMTNSSGYTLATASGVSSDGTSFQTYRNMGTITISATHQTIDSGQSTTLTATETGGSGIYTYQWYSGSSCSGTVVGTSSTYTTPALTSTTTYCVAVTDSLSNSATSTYQITVNSPLTISITPSSPIIDSGQTIGLTASPTGGSDSYSSYQWYSGSSCSGTVVGTSSTYTTPALTSTTTYCVAVTDSLGDYATSTVSITVNSAQVAGVITETNTIIDNGQYSRLAGTSSGGTGTLTINYFSDGSCGASDYLGSGASVLVNPSSTTTYSFNSVDSAYTPNSICSASNTITVSSVLAIPTISASNTPTINTGQYETFSAYEPGGSTPLTYNFIVYNSFTNVQLTNSLQTTNTFTWLVPEADAGNTINANVFVTDHATTPVTENSVLTSVIMIHLSLTAGTLTETNTVIDNGQYSRLTANPSGGTPPYTINYFSQASCAGTSIGSGNSLLVNPLASNTYSYNSVDSATTNAIVCSASNTIIVNPMLTTPSIYASNIPIVDAGQYEIFSAYESSGSSPYTYNFLVYNSVTNVLIANSLQTSNTFALLLPTAIAGNTIYANVFVTDHATTPVTENSVLTPAITVNSVLSVLSISPSSVQTIDAGQLISFSTTITGGSSNYQYTWKVYNSVTKAVLNTTTYSNVALSSNTFIFTTNSNIEGQTINANVLVMDSASYPVTVNSVLSGIQTIHSTQVAGLLTETNTIIDNGQYSNIIANPSGGTLPYTINYFSQPSCAGTSIGSGNSLLVNPLASNTYSYNSVDSATTNAIVCSASNTIIVNPMLTTPSIYASNIPIVDAGQYEIFSAYESSGSSPYTYNFLVYNSVTNVLIANSLQTSNTFAWLVPPVDVGNTINANVFVTDSATTPITMNSVVTAYFTVNTALIVNNPTISNEIIYTGQNTVISDNAPNTGSPPYSYEWFMLSPASTQYTNVTSSNSILSDYAFETNSLTPTGNYRFKLQVTDLANSIVNSSYTSLLINFNGTVSVSSSSSNTINFDNGQVLVTILTNSTNTISANVIVDNITGVLKVPLTQNTSLSTVNVVFASSISNTALSANIVIGYPCTYQASLVAPYELNGNSWSKINPFTVNSVSCTISFSIPSDPIIGTFASIPIITTTTTISPTTTIGGGGGSGGGGGGGGGGGSGGGGGGGGGSEKPTVTETNDGYFVYGIAQLNEFSFNLCNQNMTVIDNYINPNSTGVTIDANTYLLTTDSAEVISGTGGSCFAKLITDSYLPILHSVSILVFTNTTHYQNLNGTVAQMNLSFSSTMPGKVDYVPGDTKIVINSNLANFTTIHLSIKNVTASTPAPSGNYIKSIALNISTNSTDFNNMNISIGHACLSNNIEVTPFILNNDTWNPIANFTSDNASCTVSFSLKSDPVIGLMAKTISLPNTTTTTITTIVPTTVASTTIPTKVVQQNNSSSNNNWIVLPIVMVVIILIGVYYLKKKSKGNPETKEKESVSDNGIQNKLRQGNTPKLSRATRAKLQKVV